MSREPAAAGRGAAPTVVYSADRAGSLGEGARDLSRALRSASLWSSLAIQDVASRYRGSILGPWWITLTMGALIGGMSLLYAQLMHLSLQAYVPWMSCGIVLWGFISGTITEGCESFASAASIIRQTSLPLFTFVFRTVLRNLLVLGHNALIIAIVAVVFGFWRNIQPLMLLLGGVILVLNLVWIVTLTAIASARFRDVPQIVVAALQVALFITPVFWRPDQLPGRPVVLVYNPFYHLIDIVRAPLVGAGAHQESLWVTLGLAVMGWAAAFTCFVRTRRRLVHYL